MASLTDWLYHIRNKEPPVFSNADADSLEPCTWSAKYEAVIMCLLFILIFRLAIKKLFIIIIF